MAAFLRSALLVFALLMGIHAHSLGQENALNPKANELTVRVVNTRNEHAMTNVRVLFTLGEPMSPKHPASELKTDLSGRIKIPLPSPPPEKVYVALNNDAYVPMRDRIGKCSGWQEFRIEEVLAAGAVGQNEKCPDPSAVVRKAKPVAGEIYVFAKSLSAFQRLLMGVQD